MELGFTKPDPIADRSAERQLINVCLGRDQFDQSEITDEDLASLDDGSLDDTELEPTPAPLKPSATVKPAEAKPPSASASQGRDASGKLTVGNRLAKGNPFARRCAKLREAILTVADERSVRCVVSKLQRMAEAGDVAAAKLFLNYAIGKPAEVVNPDALSLDEWKLFDGMPSRHAVKERLVDAVSFDLALDCLAATLGKSDQHQRLFQGQVPGVFAGGDQGPDRQAPRGEGMTPRLPITAEMIANVTTAIAKLTSLMRDGEAPRIRRKAAKSLVTAAKRWPVRNEDLEVARAMLKRETRE